MVTQGIQSNLAIKINSNILQYDRSSKWYDSIQIMFPRRFCFQNLPIYFSSSNFSIRYLGVGT